MWGMSGSRNLFLIGPMGVGKSTVGRALADALGRQFFDTDHEIERRTGATIPWIFEIEGEAGFRRRESQMLRELAEQSGIVLATGGGVVLEEANRLVLGRGFVVYLEASLDTLVERTRRDRHRPLLQTADPRAKLKEILEARQSLYAALSDLTVTTDHRPASSVAREIIQHWSASHHENASA